MKLKITIICILVLSLSFSVHFLYNKFTSHFPEYNEYDFPDDFIWNSITKLTGQYLRPRNIEIEFDKRNRLEDIEFFKDSDDIDLGYNNLYLKKYNGNYDLLMGIYQTSPGSAFIEGDEDEIFLVSSTGIIGKGKITNKEIIFKQLKSNIENFIPKEQILDSKALSVKGFKVIDNIFYISFVEEVNENCWNTNLVTSNIESDELLFTKFFDHGECIHRLNNIDGEFEALQSGGEISQINKDEILFSIGDYRARHLSQNKNSLNGKIIKINLKNSKIDIISMGHRNAQGLFYDQENNFILATEHGPVGGDEINLIKLDEANIPNYGWPIASYGEHSYGGKENPFNDKKYIKYPFLKSHKDNGFIEPLKYFVPSIAINKIIGLGNRNYVITSLKDQSIYFFKLNFENELEDLKRVNIGERIRDIIYSNNKLILFMESTASIGIIDLN